MKYTALITFMILFMATSCEKIGETWYCVQIVNTTNNDIQATIGYPRFLMPYYPDTVLPISKPSLQIVAGNHSSSICQSFKWEKVFSKIPSDTLSVYIFDADTIKAYTWNQIKEGNKVLKRYDLSLDDLEKMNWTITYP